MNPQFNSNELAIIVNLLNRVQISGQEATTVAVLLQKINNLVQASQPIQETKTQEEKTEEKK